MANEIIKNMTNLADSGQDDFVENYTELAKMTLYEMGVSNAFINSDNASYVLAKVVTDLVEDGALSTFTNNMIATLRVNHPHSEDEGGGGDDATFIVSNALQPVVTNLEAFIVAG